MAKTWQIPRGDARIGRFSVKLDGAALDLTGYTIAWVVRDADSPAGALIDSGNGVLETGNKSALLTVGAPATATGGLVRFFACTATPPAGQGKPGPFTYECQIDVSEHP